MEDDGGAAAAAAASNAAEKQRAYLRLLQERNRLKRMMKKKSEAEQEMEEKERGFSTHFRGANATASKEPAVAAGNIGGKRSIARVVRNIPLLARKKDDVPPPHENVSQPLQPQPPRKGWALERPKFLLGMRWGVRKSGESDAGAPPRPSPMRDADSDDDDYGEYEDDFDDDRVGDDDFAPLTAVEMEQIMRESVEAAAVVAAAAAAAPASPVRHQQPISSSSSSSSSAAATTTYTSPTKTRADGGAPGAFGSPLKVNLSPAKLLKAQQQRHEGGRGAEGSDADSIATSSSSSRGINPAALLPATLATLLKEASTTVPAPATAGASAGSPEGRSSSSISIGSSSGRAELLKSPSVRLLSDVKVTVRVRVQTTWQRSKFVAVEAIRLGYVQADGRPAPGRWIDLRPFTVKVSNGLQQLPPSSDAVRTVEGLVHQGAMGRATAPWKGPLSPGTPLDVTLEGFLPTAFVDLFGDKDEALRALCVFIWNPAPAGAAADPSSLLASPAKDVDVYFGGTCVWSGILAELPPPAGPAVASAVQYVGSAVTVAGSTLLARPPSAMVRLCGEPEPSPAGPSAKRPEAAVSTTAASAAAAASSSSAASAYHEAIAAVSTLLRKNVPGAGETDAEDTRPLPTATATAAAAAASGEDGAKPSWLAGPRPASASLRAVDWDMEGTTNGGGNGQMSRPSSGRRASHTAATPAPAAAGSSADVQLYEPSFSTDPAVTPREAPVSSAAAARRRRRGEAAAAAAAEADVSPKRELVLTTGRRTTKEARESDDQLRQSLDALTLSDRLNRGRLSSVASASTLPTVPVDGADGGAYVASSSVDGPADAAAMAGAGGSAARARPGRRPSLARQTLAEADSAADGVIPFDLGAADSPPVKKLTPSISAQRLESRARRIEAVQATVESAVAALAGVVSPLDRKARNAAHMAGAAAAAAGSPAAALPVTKSPPAAAAVPVAIADTAAAAAADADGDDAVTAFHDAEPDEPYVPTLLVRSPSRVEPLKLSASLTHPLMGTSSPLDAASPADVFEDSLAGPLETSEALFATPVLPRGQTLRVEILSTWGDRYYVGLNGIDMFDDSGKLLSMARGDRRTVAKVVGNPTSINVLPEYQHDPRDVVNLVDGMNFTRDDLHVWLAPLDSIVRPGEEAADGVSPHDADPAVLASVTITFTQPTALSMVRIFNYNKSRTHCARGVRRCRLRLDDAVIFEGEVRMATGLLTSADTVSEVVLFTTDPATLEKVAKHDENAGYYADDSTAEWLAKLKDGHAEVRPRTAEKDENKENGHRGNSRGHGAAPGDGLSRSGSAASLKAVPMSATAQTFSQPKAAAAAAAVSSWSRRTRAPLHSIDEQGDGEEVSPTGAAAAAAAARGPWAGTADAGDASRRPLTSSTAAKAVVPERMATPAAPDEPAEDDEPRQPASAPAPAPAPEHDAAGPDPAAQRSPAPSPPGAHAPSPTTGGLKKLESAVGAIVKTAAAASLQRKPSASELPPALKSPPRPAAAPVPAPVAPRAPGGITGTEEDDLMDLLGELEDPAFQRYREEEQASDRAWAERDRAAAAAAVAAAATAAPSSSSAAAAAWSGLYVESSDLLTCRTIGLSIESTWGDVNYVGLAGVEILLGNHCAVAPVDDQMIFAQPRDLSDIGRYDDPRKVENLFNGFHATCDDRHMWLVPFTAGSDHVLRVDLGAPCPVAGLRVWNYNKSSEDVLRGARLVTVTADGRAVGRCVLRPAPGCDGVDFAQTVFIRDVLTPSPQRCPGLALRPPVQGQGVGTGVGSMSLLQYIKPTVRQDFEVPLLPSGLLWRFTLHGNWHDSYYVGLDAIEFYDANGALLNLVECGATVTAVPHSLADLEPFDYTGRAVAAAGGGASDPRTPDKLFSARKSTGNHNVSSAWLAPLSRSMTPNERVTGTLRILQQQAAKAADAARRRGAKASPVPPLASVRLDDLHLPRENTLFVMFPYPVAVSLLRIYNYSKTPARGVKEIAISVDGLDVYMGTLESSDRENHALGGGQSIVFTADPKVAMREKDRVTYCGGGECDVLCIDEKKVMIRSRTMYAANPNAEGVSADVDKRPKTSMHH